MHVIPGPGTYDPWSGGVQSLVGASAGSSQLMLLSHTDVYFSFSLSLKDNENMSLSEDLKSIKKKNYFVAKDENTLRGTQIYKRLSNDRL